MLPQTTVFVRIFLWICSGDKESMDDDFKPVTMITNLDYVCVCSTARYLCMCVRTYTMHVLNIIIIPQSVNLFACTNCTVNTTCNNIAELLLCICNQDNILYTKLGKWIH